MFFSKINLVTARKKISPFESQDNMQIEYI